MKAFSAARHRLLSRETSQEISNDFDCWNRNFAKSSKLVGQMPSPLPETRRRESFGDAQIDRSRLASRIGSWRAGLDATE